jgi:hypothetical protein
MKINSIILVVLSTLMLTACASVPNVALDKAHRAPIKSVALLGVSESQNIQVRQIYGVASLAGVVGGLVEGSIQAKRAQQLVQALNDKHIKFGDVIVAELQKDLAQAGITVEYMPDKKPMVAADGKTDDYSAIVTDKDAILNVWFGATGFVDAAQFSSQYQPWVVVNARLVDPKTRAIIYQKTFQVGYQAPIAHVEAVTLDPKYLYGDFDDLMSKIDSGIEGLSSGDALVAARITSDIDPKQIAKETKSQDQNWH